MPFGENDVELLQKFPLLVRVLTSFESSPSSSVNLRSILAEAQTEEYWDGILRRLALNFGYHWGLKGKIPSIQDKNNSSNDVPESNWLNNFDNVWKELSSQLEEWGRAKGVINHQVLNFIKFKPFIQL